MVQKLILACFFITILVVNQSALAHTRSQSLTNWQIDGNNVKVNFNVTALEATRLSALENHDYGLVAMLANHLAKYINVFSAGEHCATAQSFTPTPARKGQISLQGSFICNSDDDLQIVNQAFFTVAPSHSHFSYIELNGVALQEVILTRNSNTIDLNFKTENLISDSVLGLLSFVNIGLKHIFSGYDHMAFLLGLLLLCSGTRDIAAILTGFTLGHSVTLSLAALEIVMPDQRIVEALIGFTIALIAVEAFVINDHKLTWASVFIPLLLMILTGFGFFVNLLVGSITMNGLAIFAFCYILMSQRIGRINKLTVAVTFLFGLIHGFGFASALTSLDFPSGDIITALLGFNIGVELGQIAIAGLLWFGMNLLFMKLESTPSLTFLRQASSATLFGFGIYWFVGRLIY